MKNIAQIFRQVRTERSLSLRKAAELLGFDYTYLSKIENGHLQPGLEILSLFAVEFDQDLDMLLLASGRLPDWMLERILEKPELFWRVCRFSGDELERVLEEAIA